MAVTNIPQKRLRTHHNWLRTYHNWLRTYQRVGKFDITIIQHNDDATLRLYHTILTHIQHTLPVSHKLWYTGKCYQYQLTLHTTTKFTEIQLLTLREYKYSLHVYTTSVDSCKVCKVCKVCPEHHIRYHILPVNRLSSNGHWFNALYNTYVHLIEIHIHNHSIHTIIDAVVICEFSSMARYIVTRYVAANMIHCISKLHTCSRSIPCPLHCNTIGGKKRTDAIHQLLTTLRSTQFVRSSLRSVYS